MTLLNIVLFFWGLATIMGLLAIWIEDFFKNDTVFRFFITSLVLGASILVLMGILRTFDNPWTSKPEKAEQVIEAELLIDPRGINSNPSYI